MSVEVKVNVELDSIAVAKPCPADWEGMSGDERVRHCGECQLNVYNLSGLSREDAEALVRKSEGGERVCVRLFRRADGTVITQDCPVGLAAVRRRVRRVFAAVGTFVFMLFAAIGFKLQEDGLRGIPLPVIVDPEPEPLMGVMCPPPPPPPPTPPTPPTAPQQG